MKEKALLMLILKKVYVFSSLETMFQVFMGMRQTSLLYGPEEKPLYDIKLGGGYLWQEKRGTWSKGLLRCEYWSPTLHKINFSTFRGFCGKPNCHHCNLMSVFQRRHSLILQSDTSTPCTSYTMAHCQAGWQATCTSALLGHHLCEDRHRTVLCTDKLDALLIYLKLQ